ncbi:MAG: FAD-binding oxidoreductase [Pseudomonadota bacterium]
MATDVLIIGGGIVGSSIAYHLKSRDPGCEVVVVERDPTYEHAATPRSNGGIRRLFSLPENIQMATYGLAFYESFADAMRVDDQPADISFSHQGYLFVSDDGGEAQMEKNYELQRDMGVDVTLLDPAALQARFPSLALDGVRLAVHSERDAWIDPYSALMGFRAKARSLDVTYVKTEIQRLERHGHRISGAVTADGEMHRADYYVNACGAWCAPLAATVDIPLPMEPMSRESYFFSTPAELEPLPFIKTETDLAFRPEGTGYVGGIPDWSEGGGWNFEVDPQRFNDIVWPALAARIPALETLRLERSWRGHYARSQLDLSPIIGPCTGLADNFYLANGFSGHGIMHAPATGRAITELLRTGRFESTDLAAFGYHRITNNRPYREIGIV